MTAVQSSLHSSLSAESTLVLFVFEKGKEPAGSLLHGSVTKSALEEAQQDGFEGKLDQISVIHPRTKDLSRLIFAGLGPEKEFSTAVLRHAVSTAVKTANVMGITKVALRPPMQGTTQLSAQAAAEGALLGLYQFTAFQSEPSLPQKTNTIQLIAKDQNEQKNFSEGIQLGQIFSESVNFVRDLVNTPPSDMDPQAMAGLARQSAKGSVKVKIFNKSQIQKMGMGGLLGVNRGSAKDPVFVHFTYKPKRGPVKRKIGICGKGITFDSGGLSLKPAKSMETMKDDMAGAATVISLFRALEKCQPPLEVHGFAPITENMPGGDAVKPGDVLKTMRGKTIEVLNTDAEGRLVLSDALSYACRQNLDEVLDIATLTGACVVALGSNIAGLMGTDEGLMNKIQASAALAGEKIWRLPLEKEYEPLLKSSVADIKNIGPTGVAGTILGGLFLKAFVDESLPWAHIDIASTAWADNGTPLSPPGATGVMVRSLLTYLLSYD